MKKIPLLALATSLALMAWPTSRSSVTTQSLTSSVPTPHSSVPGSHDDSGFNGNFIPPTTNNGAYQGTATIDRLKTGDNGVYRGHGTSDSTEVSFNTGGGNTGQPPVQPPTPKVYKFNQSDGREATLISGLREVAKRAGGQLVVVAPKPTKIPNSGNTQTFGRVKSEYYQGAGYYQFTNIKKTISWKICTYNTISSGQCSQLPTITPSNQTTYRFRWYQNKENGADKDGIAIYKRRTLPKDIYSYKTNLVCTGQVWLGNRECHYVTVRDQLVAKKGYYYGQLARFSNPDNPYILPDSLRMSYTKMATTLGGNSIPAPDSIKYIRTNPRHYEVTFK